MLARSSGRLRRLSLRILLAIAAAASVAAVAVPSIHAGRRAALKLVCAAGCATACAPGGRAVAWCGNPYPAFAYSLPWFEFDSASGCSLRVVGDLQQEVDKGLRPIVVVPSPGLRYDYMENLEALTVSERRVCFVTLPAAGDVSALSKALLSAVRGLDAERGVHLLAHGLAAPVAIAASAAAPAGAVASLTLVSPLGCLDDASATARKALAAASPTPLLELCLVWTLERHTPTTSCGARQIIIGIRLPWWKTAHRRCTACWWTQPG